MKRASEYQLTKDNFDKDDNDLGGGDDGGDRLTSNQDIKNSLQMNNQLANPDQLKNRVVLKAKRRNISNDDQSVNVFSGFKGTFLFFFILEDDFFFFDKVSVLLVKLRQLAKPSQIFNSVHYFPSLILRKPKPMMRITNSQALISISI